MSARRRITLSTLFPLTVLMSYTSLQLRPSIANSPFRPLLLPEEYRHLAPCDLSGLEAAFTRGFSGTIQSFRSQDGVVIIRQIYGASPNLHAPDDCLRAYGFHVSALRAQLDQHGRTWQTGTAKNKKNNLHIRSIILDPATHKSWQTTQSWYRSALLSAPDKRYLAITEIYDTREENVLY